MKTIEEAARNYSWKLRRKIKDIKGDISEQSFHTFIDTVAWAERWIPINEELPPANEMIFVKREDDDGNYDYGVAYVEENRDWNVMMYKNENNFPTHWRPIEHK